MATAQAIETTAEAPPGREPEGGARRPGLSAAVMERLVDDAARAYSLLISLMDDPQQEPRVRAFAAARVLDRLDGRV